MFQARRTTQYSESVANARARGIPLRVSGAHFKREPNPVFNFHIPRLMYSQMQECSFVNWSAVCRDAIGQTLRKIAREPAIVFGVNVPVIGRPMA